MLIQGKLFAMDQRRQGACHDVTVAGTAGQVDHGQIAPGGELLPQEAALVPFEELCSAGLHIAVRANSSEAGTGSDGHHELRLVREARH